MSQQCLSVFSVPWKHSIVCTAFLHWDVFSCTYCSRVVKVAKIFSKRAFILSNLMCSKNTSAEIYCTWLSELNNKHNAFWLVTLNVNINFVNSQENSTGLHVLRNATLQKCSTSVAQLIANASRYFPHFSSANSSNAASLATWQLVASWLLPLQLCLYWTLACHSAGLFPNPVCSLHSAAASPWLATGS